MGDLQIFNFINQIIISFSTWLWPIVVLILVSMFKSEISNAIQNRVFKAEILGQKFEILQTIDEFQNVTQRGFDKVVAQAGYPNDSKFNEITEKIDAVLKAASINPELGIIALSPFLEKEVRDLAVSLGVFNNNLIINKSFANIIRLLVDKKYLPNEIELSIKLFWELRNKIIHGHSRVKSSDVLRVLDIGIQLLETIRDVAKF